MFCKDYDFTKHDVSVTIPSLRRVDIVEISIPVPPREEQERIVEELDCLSGVIEKKREQLRELDALAQSIFYQMFGDPITNEKGWEVKKLGEIATSQIGITYKPENVSDNDEGTIVLRSSNIQDNTLCFEDIVRVKCAIKENKYVKDGDILMCSRNGSFRLVGKVAMISNLSERMIGYSTKWGDSVGDFAPIANLTKSEVCELGIELGLPEHPRCARADGCGRQLPNRRKS